MKLGDIIKSPDVSEVVRNIIKAKHLENQELAVSARYVERPKPKIPFLPNRPIGYAGMSGRNAGVEHVDILTGHVVPFAMYLFEPNPADCRIGEEFGDTRESLLDILSKLGGNGAAFDLGIEELFRILEVQWGKDWR